jgi:integrase
MKQGYIEKRKDGHLVRWREDDGLKGKRKQVSKVVKGDYGAALAFLAERLNPPKVEESAIRERTFGSYMQNEWAQYVRENWKSSTQVTQGSLVRRHIVPFFEEMLVSRIAASHITAFHAALEKKGLGKKTRRLAHSILVTMFSLLVDDGLIKGSPIKRRFFKKGKKRKIEKPALSEQQLVQLLDTVPHHYKSFFMVLALTGIRTGEALGLRWEDIDFATRTLQVERAIYRGKETSPKTEDSVRDRPLCQELYESLVHHRVLALYKAPQDYVFASSTGRPFQPDQLREALKAALRGIGVKFEMARASGLHLLRHTSASIVYKHTNGDVLMTQQWLGHSSPKETLETYAHLPADQSQKTAERLAQGIFVHAETPAVVDGTVISVH